MTTREKILTEALNLFSVKGFDPVTVREIAYAVGIKESSLYNHFKNKQDIFDSIINEYSGRWEIIFNQIQLTGNDKQIVVDARTVNMYKNMTNKEFAMIAGKIFDYYMTDEINVKLRRMLTIEQYRSDNIAFLFRKISFNDSIEFQSQLFKELINEGCFIKTDPYILALEFFSPIFLIFYKYSNDPESMKEAKELFLQHIDNFNEIYGVNK
ncbi:MAG: TetR/AcrR family transcriptional regulator [Eubacteriales bacterium]